MAIVAWDDGDHVLEPFPAGLGVSNKASDSQDSLLKLLRRVWV